MASIGKLVEAIARVGGRDEATVRLMARYAREAGYISQASYGPAAARMTARDAANLLVASTGADKAKYAAAAIYDFAPLPIMRGEVAKGLPANIQAAFAPGTTFVDALSRLIEASDQDGALLDLVAYSNAKVEIELERPKPKAVARIFRVGHPVFERRFGFPPDLYVADTNPDWRTRTVFGHETLLEIARVLHQ
jgi:hypothetical protein